MNLDDLLRLKGQLDDPALEKHWVDACKHLLGEPASESKQRSRMYYAIATLFLLFYAATGTVALLATLKKVEVDQTYLGWVWTTFVIESSALSGKILISAFKERGRLK